MGRVLSTLLAENRQEALIQLLADRAFQWSLNADTVIQRVVERDSPAWSPRFIDHLVGDRIHRELMDFTDKVRRNPDHELKMRDVLFHVYPALLESRCRNRGRGRGKGLRRSTITGNAGCYKLATIVCGKNNQTVTNSR